MLMVVAAGRLNQRIVFQQQAAGTDSRGQRDGDWEDYKKVQAEVTELAGAELDRARQRHATATVQFIIRKPRTWTPDSKMRISYDDRTFHIGSIYDPTQAGEDLIITGSAIL